MTRSHRQVTIASRTIVTATPTKGFMLTTHFSHTLVKKGGIEWSRLAWDFLHSVIVTACNSWEYLHNSKCPEIVTYLVSI